MARLALALFFAITAMAMHAEEGIVEFDAPATDPSDAFSFGRGRLTATVYGGIGTEKISFFALKTDHPENASPTNSPATERIKVSRHLGDLLLDFGGQIHAIYKRTWLPSTGIIRTEYHVGGVGRGGDMGFDLIRNVIVSKDGETIAVRITSDVPGRISFRARMEGMGETAFVVKEEYLSILRGTMEPSGDAKPTYMAAYLQIRNEGGKLVLRDDALEVQQADAVTLFLTGTTTTKERDADAYCRQIFSELATEDFDGL